MVCLAVNHPHTPDFLCCLRAPRPPPQRPSATCGCPSSLCYSVGTLPCWWISTFCPRAAERTPAGLLRTASRLEKPGAGQGRGRERAGISVRVNALALVDGGSFQRGNMAVESEMTLSLLCILLSKVLIVAKLSSTHSKPLVQLHRCLCFLALECFFFFTTCFFNFLFA